MSLTKIGTLGDLLKGNDAIPPRERMEATKHQVNEIDSWISVMNKVSYVKHCKGHRNSKGDLAEWCVVDHKDGKIISSHGSEEAAKQHLQDMHIHSGNINSIDELLDMYKTSAEDEENKKEEKKDTDKEEGFD